MAIAIREEEVVELKLADLDTARYQFRPHRSITALVRSLREHGQRAPIIVQWRERPPYPVIDGNGRVEGLRALERPTARAVLARVTDHEAQVMAVVENLHRQKPSAYHLWLALRRLEKAGLKTPQELARALDRTEDWVRKLRRLLPNREDVRDGLERGWLRTAHLELLKEFVPKELWGKWIRVIRDEKLKTPALKRRVLQGRRKRDQPLTHFDPQRKAWNLRAWRWKVGEEAREEVARKRDQLDRLLDAMNRWLSS